MLLSYQKILVPVKGNPYDRRATDLAANLLNGSDTGLVILSVVEVAQELPLEAAVPEKVGEREHALKLAMSWLRESTNDLNRRVSAELLQARSAGAAIVDEAIERNVDVIIMASRNHKKYGRPTIGKTVPYVLKNAPCEVIVVRLPIADPSFACVWPEEAVSRA